MAQTTQRQIATQSSLTTVLKWADSVDKQLTLKELIAITNVFVDYVENGYSGELATRLENIQGYLEDK
jgi:hypothetical protein